MSNNKDKNFINETVARKKKNFRELLGKGAFFCVEALAFGVIAAVAFAWMEPRVKKLIGDTSEPVITIYHDSTTEEQVENDNEGTTSDNNGQQSNNESEENGLDRILDSVVMVESRTNILDDNDEKIGEDFKYSSGAVISTGTDTVILTDYDTVKDCDIIKVTFDNESQCVGYVKNVDKQLGLAVISADTMDVFDKEYLPAKNVFGNSTYISNGDELLYVGVSEGVGKINHNCEVITVDNLVQYTDCMYSMFTTDMASNVARNGFVYDEKGNLVGMIANPENNGIANLVAALGATDIKPVVEKLSNGNSLPYMGINGTTVTAKLKENVNKGMPDGVYVTSVETNSPAYSVGILNGDIITDVAGRKISSFKTFSNTINNLSTGNSVEVNVSRYGKNGYKKIKFNVIIGGKEN